MKKELTSKELIFLAIISFLGFISLVIYGIYCLENIPCGSLK